MAQARSQRAYQTPAVQAAKQATTTIPIVMTPAGDPVATGLVASLARPGGNITGMSSTTAELAVKILEFVREIRPAGRRAGFLANTADPFTKTFLEQIQSAGRRLGIEILPAMVRMPAEFDAAFAKWIESKTDSVIVQPTLPRQRAIELALKHRFVSVSPSWAFAEAGGLIGYSASARYSAQKAAAFVDKILKGAKPADLPVEQPTTFELAVNMKTAKAIGVTIPPAVLSRADRVIE